MRRIWAHFGKEAETFRGKVLAHEEALGLKNGEAQYLRLS